MLNVESVHHVAINVTDLSRARRFYSDILGLEETTRPDFDFAGAWYSVGAQQVHLIVHAAGRTTASASDIDPRGGHFALRVRSYREALDHLRAQGIACLERPRNKTPWPQIYVNDPDGNVIELNAETLD